MTEGGSGLRVTNLRKSYRKRVVIRDFSMELNRGEVVGLLGPNGSGKTTTFYAIAGLIMPEGGSVNHRRSRCDPPAHVPPRQAGHRLLYRRKCRFSGDLASKTTSWRSSTSLSKTATSAESGLKSCCLSSLSNTCAARPALALSGGERRRVEIARCLAANPKYLLLDEPFAGVDPISVGDIRHLVSDLRNRGIGVLITDHNVRETLEIVDRAYILHDGKVLMSGTPEDVVENENVRRVYSGRQLQDFLRRIQ